MIKIYILKMPKLIGGVLKGILKILNRDSE
ncbi:MAG: hypothetical protein PWP66_135 [Thermosediminibacterales bacterium]|nr:hypothetical protein [Thermosediminibacterales bacterium]MDK2901381.1 hypothetical protein [Thermosediminibacterales bacterium]